MLYSTEYKGICFVETKSLDGETNLKNKSAPSLLLDRGLTADTLEQLSKYKIICQAPNDQIYKFEGTIECGPFVDDKCTLSYSNFMLRGSSLRNTEWILGVVTYTGHETRIMKNSTRTRPKKSRLELLTGWSIFFIFLLQCTLCLIGALWETFWTKQYQSEAYYLGFSNPNEDWNTGHTIRYLVGSFFTWILLFTNMVPISLLVTLEIVKFFQAMFISWDADIYDEEKDMETVVLSNNLNEELG